MSKFDGALLVSEEALRGFIKPHEKGGIIALTIKPNAAKERLMINTANELTLYVRAQAVDNAANERVIVLLAQIFKVPKSAITIIAGMSSRKKRVYIEGLTYGQY